MNVEFCRELAQVLRESQTYDQQAYLGTGKAYVGEEPCGTPGCIAGHAAALARRKNAGERLLIPSYLERRREEGSEWHDVPIFDEARDAMGLSEAQAHALFAAEPFDPFKPEDEGDVDDDLHPAVMEMIDRNPTRCEAADVVEHMLATGGEVDWKRVWEAGAPEPEGGR